MFVRDLMSGILIFFLYFLSKGCLLSGGQSRGKACPYIDISPPVSPLAGPTSPPASSHAIIRTRLPQICLAQALVHTNHPLRQFF